MIKASACILTYNNEGTLEKCLESVKNFTDIVILDGGSSDKTLEIAKRFGARIFPQQESSGKIENFTVIRKKLFLQANEDWVLWLDSDEWLSEDAIRNINNIISTGKTNTLYSFIRKVVIGNKIIEYAYFYPEYIKRFFNKKADVFLKKGKTVHEDLIVGPDATIKKIDSVIYHSWWEDYNKLLAKDDYYLDLTIESRKKMSFAKKARTCYINLLKGFNVFIKSFFIYARQGFKKTLPISYSWRFIRYHLIYAIKILFN